MSKKYYIAKKLANGEFKIIGTLSCVIAPVEKFRVTKDRELIRKIVLAYKVKTGNEMEDKAWDRLNFGRCSKSAKQLLEYFNDWKKVVICIDMLGTQFNEKHLDWNLGTIVKNASDWKLKQEKSHA